MTEHSICMSGRSALVIDGRKKVSISKDGRSSMVEVISDAFGDLAVYMSDLDCIVKVRWSRGRTEMVLLAGSETVIQRIGDDA